MTDERAGKARSGRRARTPGRQKMAHSLLSLSMRTDRSTLRSGSPIAGSGSAELSRAFPVRTALWLSGQRPLSQNCRVRGCPSAANLSRSFALTKHLSGGPLLAIRLDPLAPATDSCFPPRAVEQFLSRYVIDRRIGVNRRSRPFDGLRRDRDLHLFRHERPKSRQSTRSGQSRLWAIPANR